MNELVKEKLSHWLKHDSGCGIIGKEKYGCYFGVMVDKCTCGLDEALAALKQKPACKICNDTKKIQVSTEKGSPFRTPEIDCPFCLSEKSENGIKRNGWKPSEHMKNMTNQKPESSEFTDIYRQTLERYGNHPLAEGGFAACDLIDQLKDILERISRMNHIDGGIIAPELAKEGLKEK